MVYGDEASGSAVFLPDGRATPPRATHSAVLPESILTVFAHGGHSNPHERVPAEGSSEFTLSY